MQEQLFILHGVLGVAQVAMMGISPAIQFTSKFCHYHLIAPFSN